MDILNFQSENPSGSDAFKGESHDRVAQAIHEYIKSKKNHRVIGLDGEFGSGKSSILQMLERKIISEGTKSKLWIFDCEQNYQGSIKSNFIELFTDEIISLLKKIGHDSKINEVVKNRDIALGRHFSYTKDTRSHISIWAILLIVSGVLSPTFIRDYLPQLRGTAVLPWWLHLLYLGASLSPIIILGLAFFFNKNSQPGKKRWNISSLLKGSSDDHISETIEISKEVSPLDLKRALAKHLHAVADNHFIIVIDNLDRLPREVLRSVWSDLEIFTSVTGTENLSVVVPFCSTKVSKYLNGDNEQGYDSKDFIAKKFPVVFRTPPIITSGWKDAFRKLWTESFGDANLSDADTCSVILQRHSPMAGGLVTPRLQKRFINDIATTFLVTSGHPSVVCIAAYIAICKYNGVSIETMLNATHASAPSNTTLDTVDEEETIDEQNLEKTKRILKAMFGEGMEKGWPIQILQIHFQTSPDIAIAELIDQPLATAIDSQDGKKLAALISYFGFMDSFVRGLEGSVSPNNLFQTLYLASRTENCDIKALLLPVSERFKDNSLLENIAPEDGYFEAIKGLIDLGLEKSIFENNLSAARIEFELINEVSYDLDYVDSYLETISRYDNYMHSLGKEFSELTVNSSEILFHLIIPSSHLRIISAKTIKLSEGGLADAVRQIVSSEAVTLGMTPLPEGEWQKCLTTYFGQMRLSTPNKSFEVDVETIAPIVTAIDLDPSNERLWLALAFFEEYSSATLLLIKRHLPSAKSPYIKIAMAIAYVRQDLGTELSEIPEIEAAFEDQPEFVDTLVRALVTSDNLFKLSLQTESSDLISPLLAKHIREKSIQTLYATSVYKRFTAITELLSAWDVSDKDFLEWFASFALKPENMPSLESLDHQLIKKILASEDTTLLKLRAEILNKNFGPQVVTSAWTAIIDSTSVKIKDVLNYMASENLDFAGEKFAHPAISSYLSAALKQIPFITPTPTALSNIKTLLKLFDPDTRVVVGTELRTLIYDQIITVESSVFILSEFGEFLPTVMPRNAIEDERLLQILALMNSDPESTSRASEFLDSRSAQLSDWAISKELKDTYASFITKLKTRLPAIYRDLSNRTGFKGRMKSLAKALLS